MKKWISCLLALLLPLCAVAESAPQETAPAGQNVQAGEQGQSASLTALGSAEIALTPDTAIITFLVRSSAPNVTEAQSAAARRLNALYAALEPLGVIRTDISTGYYGAQTQYSYQYGKLGEGESPTAYNVECGIAVELRELDRMGEIIDAALLNGAESSYDMRYESSRAQEAYDKAMELAAKDALRRAELLAKAAGVSLGAMQSIEECSADGQTVGVSESMDGEAADTELHQMLKVNAAVKVIYTVK